MHAADKAKLDLLITAANQWRAASVNAGLPLITLVVTFPDDVSMRLLWDAEANDWQIET